MDEAALDSLLQVIESRKWDTFLEEANIPTNVFRELIRSVKEAKKKETFHREMETFNKGQEEHVHQVAEMLSSKRLSIVIFGASGDLARKKTFPALHALYCHGKLPTDVLITGYNRSVLDTATFLQKVDIKKKDSAETQRFQNTLQFVSGSYDKEEDYKNLDRQLREREGAPSNRLFYLALPPTVFLNAAEGIRKFCTGNDGWSRIIIEKPFGHDVESSNLLSKQLGALFHEEQIYRIDHYLGKEMVQNMVALRFSNKVFGSIWNKESISNVSVIFKEPFGTEGRGGYFDQFGIIRDVMQNHLLQIVALLAMEPPKNLDAKSIRDEKVAVLRCVQPIELSDTVLGQYVANPELNKPGYMDDETVPKDSNTPTFATCALRISNERWEGVPFILKAGKALDDGYVIIRIQFHEQVLPYNLDAGSRNELVIRCQPNESIYFKFNNKPPGCLGHGLTTTDFDLTYNNRFAGIQMVGAYESLIYDALLGVSTNFVRVDELEAAWKIFTPLLQKIEQEKVKPIPYRYGSRGPQESDDFIKKMGYVRSQKYEYKSSGSPGSP